MQPADNNLDLTMECSSESKGEREMKGHLRKLEDNLKCWGERRVFLDDCFSDTSPEVLIMEFIYC